MKSSRRTLLKVPKFSRSIRSKGRSRRYCVITTRGDGAGYPDGIRAEEIPIGSRIVNACDAFDTITQARVFRPTVKTPEEAIRELRQLAGTWYDPAVIGALEKIVSTRWGVAIAPTNKSIAKSV